MTNFIQNFRRSIRRKLGYPEVSILVLGDNNPSTRNRALLIKSETSLNEFIIDSSLVELPYGLNFKFKHNQFIPFEGLLYFIDSTKEEMIKHERNFLWEKIVWNAETQNIPIALCAYNSNLQGALSRGELIEYLSLIRLTDRLWNLFEIPDMPSIHEALQWLKKVVYIGYVKSWEEKEKLLLKIKPVEIQITTEEENDQDI
ncbi:MAG: ADP-ribosylation factor-like protein [Candidatus Heimdallarchaeaceae archaeon]